MSRIPKDSDLVEKCYIISFQEDPIDIQKSSESLGWKLEEIEDGVFSFTSGAPMNETLIHYFEETGMAIGTFTEEETDFLRNHELIASVEEENEEQILDDSEENFEIGETVETEIPMEGENSTISLNMS